MGMQQPAPANLGEATPNRDQSVPPSTNSTAFRAESGLLAVNSAALQHGHAPSAMNSAEPQVQSVSSAMNSTLPQDESGPSVMNSTEPQVQLVSSAPPQDQLALPKTNSAASKTADQATVDLTMEDSAAGTQTGQAVSKECTTAGTQTEPPANQVPHVEAQSSVDTSVPECTILSFQVPGEVGEVGFLKSIQHYNFEHINQGLQELAWLLDEEATDIEGKSLEEKKQLCKKIQMQGKWLLNALSVLQGDAGQLSSIISMMFERQDALCGMHKKLETTIAAEERVTQELPICPADANLVDFWSNYLYENFEGDELEQILHCLSAKDAQHPQPSTFGGKLYQERLQNIGWISRVQIAGNIHRALIAIKEISANLQGFPAAASSTVPGQGRSASGSGVVQPAGTSSAEHNQGGPAHGPSADQPANQLPGESDKALAQGPAQDARGNEEDPADEASSARASSNSQANSNQDSATTDRLEAGEPVNVVRENQAADQSDQRASSRAESDSDSNEEDPLELLKDENKNGLDKNNNNKKKNGLSSDSDEEIGDDPGRRMKRGRGSSDENSDGSDDDNMRTHKATGGKKVRKSLKEGEFDASTLSAEEVVQYAETVDITGLKEKGKYPLDSELTFREGVLKLMKDTARRVIPNVKNANEQDLCTLRVMIALAQRGNKLSGNDGQTRMELSVAVLKSPRIGLNQKGMFSLYSRLLSSIQKAFGVKLPDGVGTAVEKGVKVIALDQKSIGKIDTGNEILMKTYKNNQGAMKVYWDFFEQLFTDDYSLQTFKRDVRIAGKNFAETKKHAPKRPRKGAKKD